MSFIKIKFKRKKSNDNASLSEAIENGGDLYDLNINQGEPVVFEDAFDNLYLSVGNPKDNEEEENPTLAQNAKYVKLLSPKAAEKGDNALYFVDTEYGDKIEKGDSSSFITPVASGGTGIDTLTGIIKGNGQNAMSAISIGNGAFCKKSSDTNPSFQTLSIELGGTGATSVTNARTNLGLKNVASKGIETGSFTMTSSVTPTISGEIYRYGNITISSSYSSITSKTIIDLQPDPDIYELMLDRGIYALYVENNNGSLNLVSCGAPLSLTSSITLNCLLYDVN